MTSVRNVYGRPNDQRRHHTFWKISNGISLQPVIRSTSCTLHTIQYNKITYNARKVEKSNLRRCGETEGSSAKICGTWRNNSIEGCDLPSGDCVMACMGVEGCSSKGVGQLKGFCM